MTASANVDRDPDDPLVPDNPLADSLVATLRDLVAVKRELLVNREIVTAAIHLLHEQAEELRLTRAQNARLLKEFRAVREEAA